MAERTRSDERMNSALSEPGQGAAYPSVDLNSPHLRATAYQGGTAFPQPGSESAIEVQGRLVRISRWCYRDTKEPLGSADPGGLKKDWSRHLERLIFKGEREPKGDPGSGRDHNPAAEPRVLGHAWNNPRSGDFGAVRYDGGSA